MFIVLKWDYCINKLNYDSMINGLIIDLVVCLVRLITFLLLFSCFHQFFVNFRSVSLRDL